MNRPGLAIRGAVRGAVLAAAVFVASVAAAVGSAAPPATGPASGPVVHIASDPPACCTGTPWGEAGEGPPPYPEV